MKLRTALVAAIVIVTTYLGISKSKERLAIGTSDPGDVSSVLVAGRYIPAFVVLKPEMLRRQEFPKGLVPPGSLHNVSELTNENKQWLFTCVVAIPEGHPVTRALLADASQKDALGSLIPPGKVAVSFEIDKAHGVGGWIQPGDTIAVFAAALKKTRLLFPSVQVVAVDNKRLGQEQGRMDAKPDTDAMPEFSMTGGVKVITVLVNPQAATAIIEAREEGNLSVVLRPLGDDLSWPGK